MKNYYVPLFVPFNIRNTMIHDIKKDINQIKPNKQYETLLSFMPRENIFRGLEKRLRQNMRLK